MSHWVSVILTLPGTERCQRYFTCRYRVSESSRLAAMTIFKQIPFLITEMTIQPFKAISLCWTLKPSVQTLWGRCCSAGTAAAHSSAVCPEVYGWDPNKHSLWLPHFSQPSGEVVKLFQFYKWQQRYRVTAVRILKEIEITSFHIGISRNLNPGLSGPAQAAKMLVQPLCGVWVPCQL